VYKDGALRAEYLYLLETGGSDTPEALLKPLGVDIHKSEFWQKGFKEVRGLVNNLKALTI